MVFCHLQTKMPDTHTGREGNQMQREREGKKKKKNLMGHRWSEFLSSF